MYGKKPCLECGKEHKNPKFCSSSCSVTYSNKNKPKRSLTNKCKNCLIPLYACKTYCNECWNKQNNNDMTITEAIGNRKDANKYMKIRSRARSLAKQWELLKQCNNCGYDKHVECCHIKDIAEFSQDTLLSIVNSKTNLIGLCPNCHWELDNGILKIASLRIERSTQGI